jgi:hypothetical protein
MTSPILHSDRTTVFASKSGHFDIRFQSDDSFYCAWPDVVDFVRRFGSEIYAGSYGVPEPIYAEPKCLEQLMWITNRQIINGITMYHNNIYCPKQLWYENHDRIPMIGVYWRNQGRDHYHLTKGNNKRVALHMRQQFDTPVLILSPDGMPPGFQGRKIETDRDLFDYLAGLGHPTIDRPYVEFVFADTNIGLLPGIHFIGMEHSIYRIYAWDDWVAADADIWNQRGRQVIVQCLDPLPSNNFDVFQRDFKESDIAGLMSDEVCAVIMCADRDITAMLVESLVWLGTDHERREVGSAVSDDGSIKIIYNSRSDYQVKIPPGLITRDRYEYTTKRS